MKNVFTYPNNSSTYFIDPDYFGDATQGFYKRVDDLKQGNYRTWNGTAPSYSVNAICQTMSKFNNVPIYEENSGNNSFYKWWEQPLIPSSYELHSYDIDGLKFLPKNNTLAVALVSDDPWGGYDDMKFDYTGDNWPQVTTTPSNIYVERVGAVGSADQDVFYAKSDASTYIVPDGVDESFIIIN